MLKTKARGHETRMEAHERQIRPEQQNSLKVTGQRQPERLSEIHAYINHNCQNRIKKYGGKGVGPGKQCRTNWYNSQLEVSVGYQYPA